MINEVHCTLCPRRCGADRSRQKGSCGADNRVRIARCAPHFWEEPCISGTRGSGAVFFSGCSLRCVFCQNREISSGGKGEEVTLERFRSLLFALKKEGVHNINLVTADHFVHLIAPVLRKVKDELALPIVFNCSGYESEEMLSLLDGIVDIYLADYKYADNALGRRFSAVSDYADTARRALPSMLHQVGRPILDEEGVMQKGLIVRHLVLPGERKDSLAVLDSLASLFSPEDFLLSLMSQYTPNGNEGAPTRRLTRFEYQSVSEYAEKKGFFGFFQGFSSQSDSYTPDFDGKGVTK